MGRHGVTITAVLIAFLTLGCGVSEADHEAALATIDSLRTAIDDLEYGAPRLLAQVQQLVADEQESEAISIANELIERHAGTEQAEQAQLLRKQAESVLEARVDSTRRAREQAETEARRRQERAEAEAKRRRDQAVASLVRKEDRVEGYTWYYDRSSSRYVNASSRVKLYMGQTGGGRPFLRFFISYKADDWLFIERFTINADGEMIRISPSYGDLERDNASGSIWEWYDVPARASEIDIAETIVNSQSAVIRYVGSQYYRDRTITNAEKAGLRRVLDAYEALGGR